MKVLVVEDTAYMAKAVIGLIEKLGHEVVWVIGFKDPETPVCIDPDGAEVTLYAKDFDLVFMDGDLEDHAEGKDLVPVFAKAGVPCVGTSSTVDMNEAMVEAGAVGYALKVTFFLALVHNCVSPEQFASFTEETAQALASVEAQSRAEDGKAFRQAGEVLIREHM